MRGEFYGVISKASKQLSRHGGESTLFTSSLPWHRLPSTKHTFLRHRGMIVVDIYRSASRSVYAQHRCLGGIQLNMVIRECLLQVCLLRPVCLLSLLCISDLFSFNWAHVLLHSIRNMDGS